MFLKVRLTDDQQHKSPWNLGSYAEYRPYSELMETEFFFGGLLKRARTQETPSQTAGVVCFHIAVLYKENPVGSVIAGYL